MNKKPSFLRVGFQAIFLVVVTMLFNSYLYNRKHVTNHASFPNMGRNHTTTKAAIAANAAKLPKSAKTASDQSEESAAEKSASGKKKGNRG